jgi:hypothetical protein
MDEPIACTLSPSDYRDRTGEMSALARDALRRREPIDRGVRLTFALGPATEERLRRLVAAESECCPFLGMDLRRDGDALQLDITGPEDAAPIIEQLFA